MRKENKIKFWKTSKKCDAVHKQKTRRNCRDHKGVNCLTGGGPLRAFIRKVWDIIEPSYFATGICYGMETMHRADMLNTVWV